MRRWPGQETRPWEIPLLLLLVSALSHGLAIPRLGYYWDDWPAVWIARSLGGAGLREYLAADRPFAAVIYSWLVPALGLRPWHWHLFAWLVRWLGVVAAWWLLHGLWPRRRIETASVALLLAAYPGFTQQPIAFTYAQGVLLPLALHLISLGAMVWALRKPRWFWPATLVAAPTALFAMLVVEYFVGLELLRPLLCWSVLGERGVGPRERWRRTLRSWLPYLALVLVFALWRLAWFQPAREEVATERVMQAWLAHPVRGLTRQAAAAGGDLVEVTLTAWARTLGPFLTDTDNPRAWALGWALALVVGATVFLYLGRLRDSPDADDAGRLAWARQALGIGFLACLAGPLPAWVAGRHVVLGHSWDRYALGAAFGACLLLAGWIHFLTRNRRQAALLTGLLVGLGVCFHFHNSLAYARDWRLQKSLAWQLSWRAPGLKPGTALLTSQSPLAAKSDYVLGAMVNLLYAPSQRSPALDYWVFPLLQTQTRAPEQMESTLRSLSFSGRSSDILVVWLPARGCVKVLDPARDEFPAAPLPLRAARKDSRLERIMTDPGRPASPPVEIFGSEPSHGWCYYFERADLNRQRGDWPEVIRLAGQARRAGLYPDDAWEWLPCIEAYLRLGRFSEAADLTQLAMKEGTKPPPALCALWKSAGAPAPGIETDLTCLAP